MNPRARLVRRRVILGAVPFLALLAVWGLHHVVNLVAAPGRSRAGFTVAYVIAFAFFTWQAAMFFLDRPARITRRQQHQLAWTRVMVPIPAYNEDPLALRRTVLAMLGQSRRPDLIYIVDDGSNEVSYRELARWFFRACRAAGVAGHWEIQPNGGKRAAQAAAITATVRRYNIDVIWTVDSDVLPDRRCLEEGLKPLVDPRIQTVASVVLTLNTRQAWLTRWMDLMMVSLQLTERTAMSAMNSVMVNSGASAFYRAEIVVDHLRAYLGETFFGRRMHISDDSMLTLFGLMRGRTVQQPTSIVFTLMPTTLRQHWKQQVRWSRGSFIRSWWRMRYLPLHRFAYWWHFTRWALFTVNLTMIVTVLFIDPIAARVGPIQYAQILAWCVAIQIIFGYGVMLRFFCIRRTDQSLAYQLTSYLFFTPLAVLWSATVLRAARLWATATCLNMGWGTRNKHATKPEPVAQRVRAPSPHRDDLTIEIPVVRLPPPMTPTRAGRHRTGTH